MECTKGKQSSLKDFTTMDVLKVFKFAIRHELAWLCIGTMYGVLAAPAPGFICLLAFTIAGWIVCSMLAVLTLPTCRHSHFIVVGGVLGGVLAEIFVGYGLITPIPNQTVLCLILGALVGGTSRLWELPMLSLMWILKTTRQVVRNPSV
jgi:hypothetical protein